MKKILVLAFVLFLSLPAFATDGFSSVIEDLPLMPGMVEKAEDAVIFDKPGGRIVETTARCGASAAEVKNFYRQSLPPLGWRYERGVYTRDGEILKLDVTEDDGVTIVHFNLTPKE